MKHARVGSSSAAILLVAIVLQTTTTLFQLCSASSNCTQAEPDRKWSDDFHLAKSVVANRALISESDQNDYNEPLAKIFAGEERMEEARLKVAFAVRDGHYHPPAPNEVYSVVARHMIIDQMLRDAFSNTTQQKKQNPTPTQIVILGAGFDSRAHRLTDELPIVSKWFEVDLPEPQQLKKAILREHQVTDPDHLVRIPADLTKENSSEWISALEDAGWDPSEPTIYILEGLIYYMTTEQAATLLASVPSVPHSRLIVTIVEEKLQKTFARFGGNLWKTNLKLLKKAKTLRLTNYKLRRNIAFNKPRKVGLKNVWVRRPSTRNGTLVERIQNIFHVPCERILEFEAI